MTPELNLLKIADPRMGYGQFGSQLSAALKSIGVTVYDHLPGGVDDGNVHDDVDVARRCNVVCWASTPGHARGWWGSQYPVMNTMYEATVLPELFRENLHNFELVIVPSMQNVDLFSEFHPNVKYVPLGIDPDRWSYRERQQPRSQFRFLIGGSGPRKGVDVAYEAFRRVFGTGQWAEDGPEPILIMKSPKGGDFYGSRVEMVTGKISAEEEVELYASAHCYLQPSRGEGFGLQPLQAIAQGLPTILTNAHGHEAFAHLGYGIGYKLAPAANFAFGDSGEWWEPDVDELCEYMRYVYDNYEAAAAWAAENAKVVPELFTWKITAERFVDAIGVDRLTTPFGGGEWFTPAHKKFLLRVNRQHVCNVGDEQWQFTPGVDYWVPADVKRVLFAAGYVDPTCVGPDSGLTDFQLAELDSYVAANSHCHACGQPISGRRTRADDIFERRETEAAAR